MVIWQGSLKGFVGIHPNWNGINAESIRSLCLSTYLPEEVMKLNDIAEMRAGATLGTALQSEYMTVSGACFINQGSPVMTISKNGIRFSKACHSRLDNCEYVELLYHPILQVVILRKSDHGSSTTMRWRDDNDVHSAFSARAFSGLVFQTLNWRRNCRYQCRGICRGQGNAKFLIFELDESRILTGKNQYEQENCSMNLKCRLYRSKWVQSITVSDVMESGQVVENPMIGAIPNLIGFYNILEACRHSYDEGHTPVEHLVYASSSSVYGSNKKVPYSTDDKVDNPVSLYAATKKSNELMAHHGLQKNAGSVRMAVTLSVSV